MIVLALMPEYTNKVDYILFKRKMDTLFDEIIWNHSYTIQKIINDILFSIKICILFKFS